MTALLSRYYSAVRKTTKLKCIFFRKRVGFLNFFYLQIFLSQKRFDKEVVLIACKRGLTKTCTSPLVLNHKYLIYFNVVYLIF